MTGEGHMTQGSKLQGNKMQKIISEGSKVELQRSSAPKSTDVVKTSVLFHSSQPIKSCYNLKLYPLFPRNAGARHPTALYKVAERWPVRQFPHPAPLKNHQAGKVCF